MISLPFRRPGRFPSIDALYGMIVAQARAPAFYRGYEVPDTVEGRLDMLLLHLVLVLQHLSGRQRVLPPLGQALFDRFCRDIDDNFREMGIGDLAVPKQMRRVGEMFFGRAKAYEAALAAADTAALEAAIARNLYGAAQPPLGAAKLAAYMREAARLLNSRPPEAIERLAFEFPDPGAMLSAAPNAEHDR